MELHDNILGRLLGIRLIGMGLINKNIIDNQNQEKFYDLFDTLKTVEQDVREISHDLYHDYSLKFGIISELKNYINAISNSDIEFSLSVSPKDIEIPGSLSIMIYRVVQESISNVLKHSKATYCLIKLNLTEDTLNLSIKDNGIGFEFSNTHRASIGLKSIKNRVKASNGNLNIESKPHKGTLVHITVPINKR